MNDKDLEGLLVSSGLLSQEELNKALDETKKLRRPLEKVVVDMHLVPHRTLYEAIAKQTGFNYASLENIKYEEDLVRIMPEGLSRQTQSAPIKIENNMLYVAMMEPSDLYAIDQIQMHTGMPIEVYLSSRIEIEEAWSKLYSAKPVTRNVMDGLSKTASPKTKEPANEGASIIKLVDLVIAQAVRDRASDIHIEPEQDMIRIRFRIDGILHEIPSPPKEWESAIISRIKVLSGMDIAESRIPQDGHFQVKVDEKIVDFRVATVPTIYGENMVMRLLDTASIMIGLDKLGFATVEELKKYEILITKPYGIILSTGPTGSGKTTTLYSSLMKINTIDRHIITIEDPVEYRLGLIRQIQVNSKAGITFANGLRAILRQDPDVIMVGEIRDLETAVIAVQAALTGHLVFSTLHTNDAASTITRLVNMGVEPFLISACLIGVMAQRLVRKICDHCKEPYEPSSALLARWGIKDRKGLVFYHGRGCDNCKGTGYHGRAGIFELLVVDDEVREMIIQEASAVALRKKAQEKGMRLLSEDGLANVLAGITTIEEISRVCAELVDTSFREANEAASAPKAEAPDGQNGTKQTEVRPSEIEEYYKRIAGWPGNEGKKDK
ncbi:MAG: GspE/PulE family protein [Candidatus Omnitrophica bacterium]|nr:GspE/PulE family protein [Candidatus Omnitrophota bacterium]